MSRRIVILETLNSCARLSYVSCLLRHNTSSKRWRRSDRLMLSPPFRCSLPPIVTGKVFSPGTHKKNSCGNFHKNRIVAFYNLQKSECDGLSDFRGGPRQRDRSEYFDQNRQKKPPESLLYSLAASFHVGNPA